MEKRNAKSNVYGGNGIEFPDSRNLLVDTLTLDANTAVANTPAKLPLPLRFELMGTLFEPWCESRGITPKNQEYSRIAPSRLCENIRHEDNSPYNRPQWL